MATIESKRSTILSQQKSPRHKPPVFLKAEQAPAQPTQKIAHVFHPLTGRRKASIRRREGRRFYRFDKVQGKTLDFVEFYTAGEFHCLEVRFQDRTALSFLIEPSFTVEPEHSDWKTGDWRPIDRWPLIHSARI